MDLVSVLTMSGNKRCYFTQICVFLAAILDKYCHVYGHSWKIIEYISGTGVQGLGFLILMVRSANLL